MLEFLKKLIPGAAEPQPSPAQRKRKKRAVAVHEPPLSEPPPVGEIVNHDTDWAEWEDSVQQMDSQLQTLAPKFPRKPTESQLDDLDAFARIGRRDR
jgi:hypothetical protein